MINKLDFNKKFIDIVLKYFIEEELEFSTNKISKLIKLILNTANSSCKNLAIWGGGDHTKNLFKGYSVDLKDINYIIDCNTKNAKLNFNEYNIIEPSQILDKDIDGIIISSFSYHKDINESIQKINKNIKIFDFYEHLEKDNIYVNLPFYMMSDIYLSINENRKKLEKLEKDKEKAIIIEKIIILYLKIHDFKNAFNYIDEYKGLNIKTNNKFDLLKSELIELLKELKLVLSNKKDNIILFFLDALRYKDLNNMKFLRDFSNENVKFENVFSTGITTYESVVSAFSGKMPFEKDNYKKQFVDTDECSFLKEAINKKYDLNIYSLGSDKFINGENIFYGEGGVYCSTTIWNYLTRLAYKNNKSLSLLYFLQETHTPHICGKHKGAIKTHITYFATNEGSCQTKEEYINQYNEAIKYLDEQLRFYFNFLNKENTIVFFSDHGQVIEEATQNIKSLDTLLGWHDDRYKTVLLIKNKNYKDLKVKTMFSLLDFNKLISGLMKNKLDIKYRNTVEMNFCSVHNKIIRNKLTLANKTDYIDGFKVFRNKEYKVAITGKGKIRCFKILDGNDSEIFDRKKIYKLIKKLNINVKYNE